MLKVFIGLIRRVLRIVRKEHRIYDQIHSELLQMKKIKNILFILKLDSFDNDLQKMIIDYKNYLNNEKHEMIFYVHNFDKKFKPKDKEKIIIKFNQILNEQKFGIYYLENKNLIIESLLNSNGIETKKL